MTARRAAAAMAIDDLFAEETKRCAAELGSKLGRGYPSKMACSTSEDA